MKIMAVATEIEQQTKPLIHSSEVSRESEGATKISVIKQNGG